ncbi:RNA polymerase factor sigma-54 [Dysosmobacter sp.]|uniref:RNA polymerase factor sigma-54 n=1 Tax=Dysosmobacter sp. TaxID=2591382 RepID=UPI002A8A8B4B|nr:RNA polymerase factor sigma-54 [Dysosmobacter sp.]MDY3984448.1 RNA polymerase factor sigma-54 [Dysosmobacter sp.]
MSLVTLKAELRQELKLTPQLLQSMQVLQMNSQELLEYLGKLSEENPLIEQEDSPALRGAYAELRQKASWIDAGLHGTTFAHEEGAMPERGAVDPETESLSAFLCDQLDRKRLPKPLLALCKYLAELVDEDGWLSQEDLDGLLDLKIPQALIDQALETLQSLDPAGVGARDLSECLVLQLKRQGGSPEAMEIASRFLPELSRKHYGPISRELGLTVEQIQAAEKVIASLDPHPGQAFQAAEPTVYVRPDVFIVELDGELRVVLNEYYLPRVSISGYYTRLLKESDDKEAKVYLQQKMQQAKWLLNSLERRGSTLRLCAEAILEAQQPFFAGQTGELAPMKLTSLAERLGVHPSTISRTARGKYLQCRQGTYPLRYFFSRAVSEQGPSRQAVKRKLLELVKGEDPKRPLSDQKLVELLENQGIRLARRTVAKYRMELGLGSSAARKR